MFDTISIGSATLDAFVQSDDLRVINSDQTKLIAVPYGSKCEVKQLTMAVGGGGTNTAVGLARLGLNASVLARCGWDFGGRLVRRELKKEKVDDSLLIQQEGEQTDYSTILVASDGGQSILVYRGKTKLEPAMIDFKKLAAKWLVISSIEGNLVLLEKLIGFAQKEKIKIAINPGRREISQREALLPLLVKADLLVVNEEEWKKLAIKPALASKGLTAITRGVKGVKLFDQHDRLLKADGFQVETVEATGAGDAFFSGLVAGLVKKWPLKKALKLGISNGAAAVTAIGAKAGLLTEQTYPNWLAKPLKMGMSTLKVAQV